MLRKKSVVHRSHVAAVVIAPLAFALSMSVSNPALAACVLSATAGTVVDCSGESELPVAGIPSVSIVDGATTPQIGVRLTTNGTEFENETTITSQVTNATGRNAFNVFGVATTDIDDSEWSIENEGTISAVHNGIGQLAAIGILGDAGEVTVENSGTLSITRGAITLATNSASSLTATSPGGTGNLANAAAIWVQEEENESLVVENEGTIEASGKLTAGIFTRGAFLMVENEEDGVITASGAGAVAIAAHNGTDQDGTSYFIGNTVIVNEGEISATGTGSAAIQIVDGNGLRVAASRLNEGGGPYDSGIAAINQLGRRDSTIINSGEIEGNIYLGAGNHVLVNTAEGEIEGNIDVDQRRNFTYSVGPSTTFFRAGEAGGEGDDDDEGGEAKVFGSLSDLLAAYPEHYFEFDNAAPLDGNLTVHTNVTGTTPSTIVLRPHITGSGAGSSEDAPSEASGYIDGTLAIGRDGVTANGPNVTVSTIATTTTLTPVIDSLVHSGEWYLVARTLFGSDLPQVEEDSVLVDWEAAKNTSGSLVIGSTVNNASIVNGLSAPGIATLNALMQGGNTTTNGLGALVQGLTSAEDVRKIGEQLAPETNFATQQAAWTLSMMTGNYIDNRLNGVGATSSPSSAFPAPSGLGMGGQTASISQAPEGRMSLGFGTNDGRMNIGANDGRMDAGIYDKDPDLRQRGYSAALWGQAFGAALSQDQLANVDGYRTHLYGGIVGADNMIDARTRVGIAGGYGNTSINGDDDTKRNETEVDSYLGLLYGAYKGNGWYLSTRGGYAWNDYTTTRFVTVPTTIAANGSHSGNQYMASAEVGSPLHYYGATLTPVASLNWNRLEQDGYQESSVVGLKIASQENDSLQSGLGAKALIPIATDTLIEGRAVWYHEFEDTNQQVTAAFGGGANFTAAGPNVGRDTAAVGVGMFAYTEAGVSVQLNYDALLRQDFIGHTGSGRVKVEF